MNIVEKVGTLLVLAIGIYLTAVLTEFGKSTVEWVSNIFLNKERKPIGIAGKKNQINNNINNRVNVSLIIVILVAVGIMLVVYVVSRSNNIQLKGDNNRINQDVQSSTINY